MKYETGYRWYSEALQCSMKCLMSSHTGKLIGPSHATRPRSEARTIAVIAAIKANDLNTTLILRDQRLLERQIEL